MSIKLNFLNLIIKYLIIFGLFFFIANIFLNIQINKIENKVTIISEELSKSISLQKLEKEIIRSAEGKGIDSEKQKIIAESLSVIYNRDILPIIIKMSLND